MRRCRDLGHAAEAREQKRAGRANGTRIRHALRACSACSPSANATLANLTKFEGGDFSGLLGLSLKRGILRERSRTYREPRPTAGQRVGWLPPRQVWALRALRARRRAFPKSGTHAAPTPLAGGYGILGKVGSPLVPGAAPKIRAEPHVGGPPGRHPPAPARVHLILSPPRGAGPRRRRPSGQPEPAWCS